MSAAAECSSPQYAEAQKHIKKAKQNLSTSILNLRFSPNYDIGALEYAEAATCLEAARAYEEAVDIHKEIARIRGKKQHDPFSAGRALEAAGNIMDRHMKSYEGACMLWKDAAKYFLVAGKADVSARLLQKVASTEAHELGNVENACAAYEEAIEVLNDDEKFHYSSDVYKTYLGILIDNNKFPQAIALLGQHNQCYIKLKQFPMAYQNLLSKVVLHLRLDDPVSADKAVSEGLALDGFTTSRQFQFASDLVQCYEAGDSEKLQTLTNQVLTFLPVSVARVAKHISLPSAPEPSTTSPTASPGPSAGNGSPAPGRSAPSSETFDANAAAMM